MEMPTRKKLFMMTIITLLLFILSTSFQKFTSAKAETRSGWSVGTSGTINIEQCGGTGADNWMMDKTVFLFRPYNLPTYEQKNGRTKMTTAFSTANPVYTVATIAIVPYDFTNYLEKNGFTDIKIMRRTSWDSNKIDYYSDPVNLNAVRQMQANSTGEESSFKNGVYYDKLKKLKKLSDWTTLIDTSDSEMKKINNVWSWITRFDSSTDKYYVTERIDKYLHIEELGINPDNMENASSNSIEELKLRYIDFLMTLYIQAKDSVAESYWKSAIDKYVEGIYGTPTNSCNVAISAGFIARGYINYTDKNGKNVNKISSMLGGCQDLLDVSLGIESDYSLGTLESSQNVAKALIKDSQTAKYYNRLLKSLQLSVSRQKSSGLTVNRTYTSDNIFGSPIVSRIIRNRISISGANVSWAEQWNPLSLIENLILKSEYFGTMLVPAYEGPSVSVIPKLEASLEVKTTLKEYIGAKYIKFKEVVTNLKDSPELSIHLSMGKESNSQALWKQFLSSYKYFVISVEFTQVAGGVGNDYPPKLELWTPKYVSKSVVVSKKDIETWISSDNPFHIWTIKSLKNHPIGEKKYQQYKYNATVKLYYSNTTDDISKMEFLIAKTNDDKMQYLNKTKDYITPTPPSVSPTPVPEYGIYTSEPDAYSELKEGSIYNETFEAMAGVPTTRTLYFATGGSEFMVEVETLYDYDKTSTRKYRSYFSGNVDCEFKETDNAKTATLGGKTVQLHNGGTYTETWTGTIPNKAQPVTTLHSAKSVAQPDYTEYNAKLAEANAYITAVNGTTLSYTSGSDKKTRTKTGWNARITTNSKVDPVTTTASVACQKRDPVDEHDPGVPCQNEMATAQPGAAGSFTITVTYTVPAHILCGPCCNHTLGSVEDTWTQEVNFDTLKITDVRVWKLDSSYVGGMQEITYDNNEFITANIVQGDPNIFYNIASSDTSVAGRLRYSLQQGQHDDVTWYEQNAKGVETRSDACNGMSGTISSENPIPVPAGQGHKNSWATGILYDNKTYSNTVDYHATTYPGLKTGITSNSTDAVDKKTIEYQRFNERRNQKNTVTVISDMLVLQTSSGDQAVVYFEAKDTATSQTNFKDIQVTFEQMWNNNSLSAANWKENEINIGSYNGMYYNTSSKYTGTGNNTKIATAFDNDVAKSTATDELGKSRVVISKTYTAGSANKSSPGDGQYRMVRPSNLRIYTDKIKQDPTNRNRSYTTGQSYAYYKEILSYTGPKSTGNANIHNEDITTNDMGQVGYTIRSRYRITDSIFGKINNILTYNPVSVANATIVSLPDEMDQRITIPEGSAQSMLDTIAASQVCPLSPALCEFRVKNCKFFVNTVKGSFDFEKVSTLGEKEDGVADDTSIIRSLIKSSAGVILDYKLPTGYKIVDDSYGFGSGRYLSIDGSRLGIELSDMGFSYNKNLRIKVESNIYIPSSSTTDKMLYSFDGLGFYIPAGKSYGVFTTGNGEEKRINYDFTNKYIKLGIVFSFGNIEDCEVYVNDYKITNYATNVSSTINEETIGYKLYLGTWTKNNNYKTEFIMDNLTITRMAGVNHHTESCYDVIENHDTVKQYTCGNKTNGVYDLYHVHNDNCTYIITENNKHVHHGKVGINLNNVQLAMDKYNNGDGSLLEAMLGKENYSKFITMYQGKNKTFGYTGGMQTFTAPSTGTYSLEAWGASGGDGVNNNQSLTSHGGLGGYSSGNIYLNKGQKIYVYVGGKGAYSTALGTGGGYNGGGHGGPAGYGGGGMTHFSYGSTDKDYMKTITVGEDVPIRGTVYHLYQYNGYVYAYDINGKGVSSSREGTFVSLETAKQSGTCLGTYSSSGIYDNGILSYTLGRHTADCDYGSYVHVAKSTSGPCLGCSHSCSRVLVEKLYKVSDSHTTTASSSTSINVKAMNFDLSQLILAAGGGGGADNAGTEATGGTDDGTGGYGGGLSGGNAKIDGVDVASISSHVHDNSCYKEEQIQANVCNGGYSANGNYTNDPGSPQRTYAGTRYYLLHSSVIGDAAGKEVVIGLRASSLTGEQRFFNLKLAIERNGTVNYFTIAEAINEGIIAWPASIESSGYSNYPTPDNVLYGQSSGVGTYANLTIKFKLLSGSIGTIQLGTLKDSGPGDGLHVVSINKTLTCTKQPGTISVNAGLGGSQISGYSNGAGESATNATDTGGAGGGYFGGFVTNHSNGGAGGGSGYIGKLINGVTISGNSTMPSENGGTKIGHSGNGYAKITCPMTAEDILAFIESVYNTLPPTVNGLCNPIFDCNGINNVHECTSLCGEIKVLNCTEPHHKGLCYDYDNDTCWDPCRNDHNHKSAVNTVTTPDGETIDCGTFINLDNYFTVYFPNVGDFYGNGEYGISNISINRGKGYVDNMNTLEWLREKRVRFAYDVLFNRNGVWEQVSAGEWVTLPIRNGGKELEYYEFYCLLANSEAMAATVEFSAEAINAPSSPGGKENPYLGDNINNADCEYDIYNTYETNRKRFSTYTSYHSAYRQVYTDIVGRIGNLIIEDSEDFRFSNFFKQSTNDNKWIVEGVIHEVDPSISKNYIAWFKNDGSYGKDIRGISVNPKTGMYNTYGTQKWTSDTATAIGGPLSGDKNTVESIRNQQLKAGYNLLFDISTIGNYHREVQVIPYFYALNTDTNVLTPVDVYMNVSGQYEPINYFGLLSEYVKDDNTLSDEYYSLKDKLYDYIMTLNWRDEAKRRNYTDEEEIITKSLGESKLEFVTDSSGNVLTQKYLTIPYGDAYSLGTAQLLLAGTRARTFIGTSKVNSININGGNETNINGSIGAEDFMYNSQRWHLKLGLPSSVAYVAYRNKTHLDPMDTINLSDGKTIKAIDEFKSGNYVIIMTAHINVIGNKFSLGYNQGADNGVIDINGKKYTFGDNIPTVLGVYECSTNATVDIDFVGTH